MKRLILFVIISMIFVSCSGDDGGGNRKYSKDDIAGIWQVESVKINGRNVRVGESEESSYAPCDRSSTFIFNYKGYDEMSMDFYDVACNKLSDYHGEYYVDGNSIYVKEDGKTIKVLRIKSLSASRMTLVYSDEVKKELYKELEENYSPKDYGKYTVKDILNAEINLIKKYY
ncbi:hypothetical protein EQP59_09725 [Ornithobacterium rhinotracheale]|uniref:Lipocalin-like domain-containing protein n=1 Tax=Ornithobacterium rhinotracheale TaxID=28251 RepID=A0A3R5USV1_ORNRH|nr:lipocalin family protein [Ornithobacterium rhinotracheale]QAR30015.1 hypothetical protein EQP59_00890 [Ornithobacterium rhinotracheale]QAR31598.1 hypothetical protein EQP59_09725 [Ornithobacterium rhinotracheale]